MAAKAEEMAPGRSSLCSRSGWLTWGAPVRKAKNAERHGLFQILSSFSQFIVTEYSLNARHYSRQPAG